MRAKNAVYPKHGTIKGVRTCTRQIVPSWAFFGRLFFWRPAKMLLFVLVALGWGLSVAASHVAAHPTPCTVQVVRVIDGDTLVVNEMVLLGPHMVPWIGPVSVRLLRVDTPERGQPDFERAKAVLVALTRRPIGLEIFKRDSFGRWLAELYTCTGAGRKNINDRLRKEWPAR